MAGRRAARRTALVLLYQWDVTGQPSSASLYEGEIDDVRARRSPRPSRREREELDARITEAVRRLDGRPARRASSATSCAIAIHELDRGEVPRRGGDRRGGHAREALRVRGRRAGS